MTKHKTRRLIAILTLSITIAILHASPLCSISENNLNKPIATAKPKAMVQTNTTVKPKPNPIPEPPKHVFRVTAYTGIDSGEAGDDITASGRRATPYLTVAASREYPFGTILEDVKTHERLIVQDRGGAITGHRLDLYVGHSNTRTAEKFGVQYKEYYIIYPKKR